MKEVFNDELIDQYWDDNLVDDKINSDITEDIDEELYDSRTDSPFSINDEITIDEYVNKYLRIKGNFRKLRHFELKNMNCPYIIGIKNEYADNNPKFVTEHKYLLIVIDSNGKRGTYINPILAREYINYDYKEAEHAMKQRHEGLEQLDEFLSNFIRIKNEYDAYKMFFNVLKENKKITKFKKIEKDDTYFEMNIGDEDNDKHKRK